MAAILRVKRCLDENPLDTLILECKKRKIETTNKQVITTTKDDEVETTVLKFAGTINKGDNVFTHIKEKLLPDSDELKANFKKHSVNLKDKLRIEHQEASKNSRYKIVNYHRASQVGATEKVNEEVTILDVETDLNENSAKIANKNNDKGNEYVYDLYYTDSNSFGETDIEEYVSIYPLNDPLLVRSIKDDLEGSNSDEDSEDSNAENYWRNDYPDEDDMESVNEDDMVEAMNKVDLDDLLSSDYEEDLYSAGSDSEYEDALGYDDVNTLSKRFAAFKAKHRILLDPDSIDNFYLDKDECNY
ncbi:probable RNA polymerase II nuclear localization protein SLC7A6OS [Diorhabda sublineata]|uniref:probable RNA polymerase II nuclear localization protein SLC7A6OS n=1 Tax=Diorhabda sublineata TaxID=1163346 RepID=UPI0024E15701|nr:probable RNA polymerase II nuclear localization protein SLC7A6OS [Diorhabda sublineata]